MPETNRYKRTKENHTKSIEEICSATWEPLYRYVYFRVQNRQEAEDITQEAYVKALSYSHKGAAQPENYIAYLKTIALNVLRDRWRKNKRQGVKVDMERINPSEMAVEDPAVASNQRILIQDALKKLGREQQRVLELRIIKGFSVAQTAGMMNKKENAVRVLQYRALQTLADILDENGQTKEV